MSTSFETSFDVNDIISVDHVKQFADPVNDLESGAAWFRADSGSANAAVVDFSTGANPIDASAMAVGQIIHFKAAAANTGAATLTVNGTSSSQKQAAITKRGGDALNGREIQAGQIVSVVYNDTGGGRFELLNHGEGGTMRIPAQTTVVTIRTF